MDNELEAEDIGQKIVDLYEQLTNMPEYKVLEKVKALEMSKYVLQTNYVDFNSLLTANVDVNKIRKLKESDRRLQKTATLFEITRLLANLVASVKSYIEHTKILHRELYKKNESLPEYQSELEKHFKNSPLVQFVEDLRDYCLHFQAPPVSSSLYWSQINAVYNTGIKLDKDELDRYSKWSPAGKKYLANQSNQVDLLSVVDEYYALVMDFSNWFQSHLKEIHSAEMARVDALQKEIESLLKQEYSRS
jgi:hypothetical protein